MGVKTQVKYSIFLLVIVTGCLFLFFAGASYDEILSDKKKQSEILEKRIIETKNSISGYSTQSGRLRVEIDSIESAVSSLKSFLKNYEDETYMTPDQIAVETNMIIFLAEEVESIQESFRKRVINLYKKGKNYELELLLSAKTPNEYLRRNQYLQRFSQNRKKELRELKSKKFILEEKKKMVTLSTSSQRFYVETKRKDKAQLESRLKDLKSRQAELEYESSLIAAKVERYESQLNNVKNFINNLQQNSENFSGSKTIRENYDVSDLSNLKGNINLPLDIGVVNKEFNDTIDNATRTVSFNNGVNFSVAEGSKVYAVAGGVVTLTGTVPYYGKVIIITHDGGYKTVYACLSEVNVSIGDNVKPNHVIARSGSTIDGQILHFELWQSIAPVNPREWLKF
jgi:murein DD-endopeptidase MepM/ murein hydrolase activator NlpD